MIIGLAAIGSSRPAAIPQGFRSVRIEAGEAENPPPKDRLCIMLWAYGAAVGHELLIRRDSKPTYDWLLHISNQPLKEPHLP